MSLSGATLFSASLKCTLGCSFFSQNSVTSEKMTRSRRQNKCVLLNHKTQQIGVRRYTEGFSITAGQTFCSYNLFFHFRFVFDKLCVNSAKGAVDDCHKETALVGWKVVPWDLVSLPISHMVAHNPLFILRGFYSLFWPMCGRYTDICRQNTLNVGREE